MKIAADENMPALEATFAPGNELILLDGRQIRKEDLGDVDVLLVRSITRVDADLLNGSKVKFVGTATIGIDHLDTPWLAANNIQWANAPGCNADAAAQYTLAMMMLACERLNKDFLQQSVGIIGSGNVGSRLAHLLRSLGMSVLVCDPPLQDLGHSGLVSLQDACQQNIVSVHVPLTQTGPYPTQHLFNQHQLGELSAGTLLVNAARGGVLDAGALLAELETGRLHAALDVWPSEPFIDNQLLELTTVATPHVAGSSVQGKSNGTYMIYRSFLQAFSCEIPAPETSNQKPDIAGILDFTSKVPFISALRQLVFSSCPIARDDQALRALIDSSGNATRVQIDALRRHYPRRSEFDSWAFRGAAKEVSEILKRLGFLSV